MFDMMWNTLIQSAKDDDAGRIICLFYALDECETIGPHGIIQRLGIFHRNWIDGGRDLTSSSVSQNPKVWQNSLQPSESNRILNNVCLAYLMLSDPNNEPPNNFERHHLHPEYRFLDYAAEYRALRFRLASSEDQESNAQSALAICDSQTMRCRTLYSLYRRFKRSKGTRSTSLCIASYSGLRGIVQLLSKQTKCS